MIFFQVEDMTCGHCVNTIAKAVNAADKDATVHIDLAAKCVGIDSRVVDVAGMAAVIRDAGYTPVVLEGGSSRSASALLSNVVAAETRRQVSKMTKAPALTPGR